MKTLDRAPGPGAGAPDLSKAARPAGTISSEDYKFLQDYVYRQSGIVLDHDKHYLMDARLGPIVRKAGLGTMTNLCNLLRGVAGVGAPGQDEVVRRDVVNAMTTNETLFFRELAQYEALQKTVLPQLMAERQALRRLRFWSAAASTGQEAYTLAMLLLDIGVAGWNVQIHGTDLNEAVLERARLGRYLQIEVNRGLPANYLLRYFTREGLEWQLKDEVKRLVQFERLDLRQSLRTRGPYDIIFCRNVLIYFDVETKRKILSEMRGALHRGGYLLLGGAETTLNIDGQFRRIEMGSATLYQVA